MDSEADQRTDSREVESSDTIVAVMGNFAEILTRLELDLAYASEKIVNLNVLMMHVGTRENDFEAFALKKDREFSDDSLERALEFDFLSGIMDSEVRDLDGLMAGLQSELFGARELVSSSPSEDGAFKKIEEKLRDSEQSFDQSRDQISEIRAQSETLQKALSRFIGGENWNNSKSSVEDHIFNMYPNIKMATVEQQRHILRMLEKSLAREIDLEKKLAELRARQVDEDLKQRLLSSEREVYDVEYETDYISGRWFTADNNNVVSVKGFSKEVLERIQTLQFVINGSVALETRLRPELKNAVDEHKESEVQPEIGGIESLISDLKEKAESAEAKCRILTKTNTELNKELSHLKSSMEKVESLETMLKESDLKLQCEIASAEACQEKLSLLYSSIEDMENLIDNLKMKVVTYETRAESAEEKCMALYESNAELNEVVTFLQGRLGALEASLQQAKEAQISAAKDIGSHTKVVNKIVLQLAFERNRLHNQISSLAIENKRLVQKLQENNIDQSVFSEHGSTGIGEEFMLSKRGSSTLTYSGEIIEEVAETSPITSKLLNNQESVLLGKTGVTNIPGPETVRRIDAGVLSFKHVLFATLISLISVGAYYSFHSETCPF